MQRTNICYVITKSNFGGAQKYVYELATSLPNDQFQVTVALGGEGKLTQKLQEAGIRTIIIPNLERDISFFKEISVFRFLYNLFNDEHFDVVHLNSSKIGGLGGLAARIAGTPRIIFTAHGFAFNEKRSNVSKFFIKLSYWATMMLADTTIAVSQAIKEQVQGWPLVRHRITVIQNGVRSISFLEQSDARTKLAETFSELDIHQHWVGTLAELHHIKGLDIFIDAVAQLHKTHPRYQFVVMGEGEARKELEVQIQKAGLEKTFILLGYIDQAATYLKALDVFVLPSRSEALALAILEAGLAELPVIATRVGGIPEVIKNNESGVLIAPADVPALHAALEQTIEHASHATSMAQKLHQTVVTQYSHEMMLEKTIKLYRQN